MSYDRVQKLEQVALRSQWFTRPHIFGESMYAPSSVYEDIGRYPKIVEEQLQSTRKRLELLEGYPLIVGDLGCAFGIAVAQLNQMEGIKAFGVDQYRYPDINAALKSGNLRSYFDTLSLDELISLDMSYHSKHQHPLQTKLGYFGWYMLGLLTCLKEFGLHPKALRRERHIVSRIQRMKRIHDSAFDFLMSSFTLIHLEGEDFRQAVREINRVLVPKGGVLLHVGEENARSAGAYFERLRNVKVLYSGDDSLIHFKYE